MLSSLLFFSIYLLFALEVLSLSEDSTPVSELPNVVILFADNLGYNDIGVFGGASVKTPNIDRLATEGIKMNNWNSAAHLCSASRAALLTGKYPVKTGVYPGVFKPDAVNGLPPDEKTLAEFFPKKSNNPKKVDLGPL